MIQTFGGPQGQFVDPPEGTGIYATCDDAPVAPPPCLTVGEVDYEYGIGEYEVTVSQYVTFPYTTRRGVTQLEPASLSAYDASNSLLIEGGLIYVEAPERFEFRIS